MKIRKFSIIEVILSLVILAIGVTSLMSLQSVALARVASQNIKQKETLLMSQAAEFFLLAGHDATIPSEVFDEEGYNVVCSLEDFKYTPEEDNNFLDNINGYMIATLKIELFLHNESVDIMYINSIQPME